MPAAWQSKPSGVPLLKGRKLSFPGTRLNSSGKLPIQRSAGRFPGAFAQRIKRESVQIPLIPGQYNQAGRRAAGEGMQGPPKKTVPAEGLTTWAMAFKSVDFPQPLGPIKAAAQPFGTEKETSWTADFPSYWTERDCTLIICIHPFTQKAEEKRRAD